MFDGELRRQKALLAVADAGGLQPVAVIGRDLAPASIPLLEPFQLGPQDGRL